MKKRLLILLLSLFVIAVLTACSIPGLDTGTSDDSGTPGTHTHTYGEWVVTKEPTCKEPGSRKCVCTECGDLKIEDIARAAHTPVKDEAKAPSCSATGLTEGSHCSVCLVIIEKQTEIPKTEHTEAVLPATDKKTEGKYCSVCHTVLVSQKWLFETDYVDPESYDSDYGYTYLMTLSKGEAMCKLYQDFDRVADLFHTGEAVADGDVVARLNYSGYGLTDVEAMSVWASYKADRPLYYWISSGIRYTDESIYLLVEAEYAETETRLALNDRIYERVESYITALGEQATHYGIALGIHDMLIDGAEYAYEADGVTPSVSAPSHNIIGVMLLGEGVCESYAKAFQLILNFSGIENAVASGYGYHNGVGEAHAWNMAKMDDGKWYWFDLTWDDQPNLMLGRCYNYFCISDGENVVWSHGNSEKVYPTVTFLETHIPMTAGVHGANFCYALPVASDTPFESSEILKTTFEKDGFTYAVCGFNTVQLIGINKTGEVVIPSSVTYNQVTYRVASVGRMTDGILEYDSVSDREITGIVVPGSIEYIWVGAFNIPTLESITVSDTNPKYASDSGILYSRDYTEFIWVPQSIKGAVTVRPEVKNYSEITFTYCPYITSVTLPLEIDCIARRAFYGCRSLTDIYVGITINQWTALPKGEDYCGGITQAVTVHLDGAEVLLIP